MKKYCIALALLVITQGCTDKDTSSDAGSRTLEINVQITGVQSKAVVTNSISFAGPIDVVVKNANTSENSYGANGTKKKYTKGGSGWTTDTPLSLDFQGTVTAIYPSGLTTPVVNTTNTELKPEYMASATLTNASTITLDGKTIWISANETDYLVGTGTDVSGIALRSSIRLQHVMAMVAIRLVKGTTYSGLAALTQITVANAADNDALCKGTVTIRSNDFAKNSTQVSYTRTLTDYNGVSGTAGAYVGFLAYPAILYENGLAELTLTVDGAAPKKLPLPGDEQGDLHWKAGNCIFYDVTIQGTQLVITGVTVTQWQSGSQGNIGVQ